MVRMNLIKARQAAHLTQLQLAQKLGVERQAMIAEWESGKVTPSLYYQKLLCDILGCTDANLFDDVQLSVKDILEMLRREFMGWIAKIGGLSTFGDVTIALVSTPAITQDEYIEQARTAIRACWELLNIGSLNTVEQVLNANMPKLGQLARTAGPYQHLAATLGLQGCIMRVLIATRNADFLERESIGVEAVRFGELSGDRDLQALALDWHANTYVMCYKRPQVAIPLLEQALSLNAESALIKSAIYSNLSLAYSQDKNLDGYERKAKDFIEQAHMLMPDYPALDSLHQCIQWDNSSLNAVEGKMYSHLVESLPDSNYAQMAIYACEKSINEQSMVVGRKNHSSGFIRKADALRALGEMRLFIDSLEQGLYLAIQIDSKFLIRESHNVMGRIPEKWQKEDRVIDLQKEVVRASSKLARV